MSLIDEAIFKNFSVNGEAYRLRFFTKSPFDQIYVQAEVKNYYCENVSYFFWEYFKNASKDSKNTDFITADKIQTYYEEQIKILRYNNPKASKELILEGIRFIESWSVKDGIKNYTNSYLLEGLVESMFSFSMEEISKLIEKETKINWYSDRIEYTPKKYEETWSEYTKRKMLLKASARKDCRMKSDIETVVKFSNEYYDDNKYLPTVPEINTSTSVTEYKIKRCSEKDIHWITVSSQTKQRVKLYYEAHPNATNEEVADVLGLGLRTVKRYK